MYDTTILCTYKLMNNIMIDISDDDDDNDNDNDNDNNNDCNILYQIQLLQILQLESFDEEKLNDKINLLYHELKDKPFVKMLIESNSYYDILGKNEDVVFRTLFSYDFFDLFHKCVVFHMKNDNEKLCKVVDELKLEFLK